MVEQIKCPECKQRLFDLEADKAEIEIKCPRCRKIITIKRPDKGYNRTAVSYRATEMA